MFGLPRSGDSIHALILGASGAIGLLLAMPLWAQGPGSWSNGDAGTVFVDPAGRYTLGDRGKDAVSGRFRPLDGKPSNPYGRPASPGVVDGNSGQHWQFRPADIPRAPVRNEYEPRYPQVEPAPWGVPVYPGTMPYY